jgi:hypothetical protein
MFIKVLGNLRLCGGLNEFDGPGSTQTGGWNFVLFPLTPALSLGERGNAIRVLFRFEIVGYPQRSELSTTR